ncbi:MAG: MoaD/ThiS family protein [Acidobacteriota bacterium]|nr:MoaD/ThiS family protein [Acidobacteriota bacterium]
MPRVVFTPNLERHVAAPPADVTGATVRELLDGVFESNPKLRGYVLDDQGRLRQHVVVFVNGEMIRDRERLGDEVGENDEIFVMQALSGG